MYECQNVREGTTSNERKKRGRTVSEPMSAENGYCTGSTRTVSGMYTILHSEYSAADSTMTAMREEDTDRDAPKRRARRCCAQRRAAIARVQSIFREEVL